MKNRWTPILFLAVSLALGVLSVQGTAAPGLRSELDSYPMTVQSIVFRLSNNSSREIIYDASAGAGWFEVQTSDGWERCAIRPDLFFTCVQIGMAVPPNTAEEIEVGLRIIRDDTWESGTYRYVCLYSYEFFTRPEQELVLISNEFALT